MLLRRKRCDKGGVHNFEARYSTMAPEGFFKRLTSLKSDDPRAFYEKIYIHDICTWCGEIKDAPPFAVDQIKRLIAN